MLGFIVKLLYHKGERIAMTLDLKKGEFAMDKKSPIILLMVSCSVLIISIAFCVYSLIDIHRILNELASNPGASGIDYWGLGWGYGICLFGISTLGLILSIVSIRCLEQKKLQYIAIAAMVVFILLLMVSLILFYA